MRLFKYIRVVSGMVFISINVSAVQIGDRVVYLPRKEGSPIGLLGRVTATAPHITLKLDRGEELQAEKKDLVDEKSAIMLQRKLREYRRRKAASEFLVKKECKESYNTMSSEVLARFAEDAFRASNYEAASFFFGSTVEEVTHQSEWQVQVSFPDGLRWGVARAGREVCLFIQSD